MLYSDSLTASVLKLNRVVSSNKSTSEKKFQPFFTPNFSIYFLYTKFSKTLSLGNLITSMRRILRMYCYHFKEPCAKPTGSLDVVGLDSTSMGRKECSRTMLIFSYPWWNLCKASYIKSSDFRSQGDFELQDLLKVSIHLCSAFFWILFLLEHY